MDAVMDQGQRFFTSILAVLSICGWFYLFGAFCAASFDIATWDGIGRTFIAMFATIGSAVAVSVINQWE